MGGGIKIIAVISGALMTILALSIPQFSHQLALEPQERPPKHKEYVHEIAEGLAVQSPRCPGQELLRMGSCRIEKQRNGGFTFGAFNVLVIDQLDVVMPPSEKLPERKGPVSATTGSSSGGNELAREMQSLLSQYPRFSSLCINGLRIGRMESSNEYQSLLDAKRARAGRNQTLRLYDCDFMASDGQRIQCKEARLELKPPFRISTGRGSFFIAGIADGLGPFLGMLAGK